MECYKCGGIIDGNGSFKDIGGSKFECEGCADIMTCMHCKETIRRGESYHLCHNGTYICESCGNRPRCESCEEIIVGTCSLLNGRAYHAKCTPDLPHE